MEFQEYIKKGIIRKTSPDKQLAKSLMKQSKQDKIFLDSLEITDLSARKIASNYYDILRSILEAIASLDGYKIYNHEGFTYYLQSKDEQKLASKFDRLRKIRNNINYYGATMSKEEAEEIKSSVNELLPLVINKYLKDLEEIRE
ncbi:hypothetical protein HYZ97_01070 [Candidatus Pacearchaeota archaeon]|nr:hypothetical protein [Candidatus Pacearchaeota archaeon]